MAASPVRSASGTWTVITNLVADTVAQAPALSRDEALEAMAAAEAVGRMLIAAGHLNKHAIILVAGKVHCEITTVSGTAALTAEENLNAVPGAAGATEFTIYLPSPTPLQQQVSAAADRHPRLSTAVPPSEAQSENAGPLVDLEALRWDVAAR
ncbi:hypothetical protein [Frankia sp. CgS1]|uniref:hypothetical protein n=1 Tax=Frankia sp. CgS1 TaxID=1745381 RepID=UPI0004012480|nr:hypothetical protein [Frankia sp. CgIS1]